MKTEDKCERCGALDNVVTYRQRTMYENGKDNMVTLCEPCRQENDEYWDEKWDEYYRGCL